MSINRATIERFFFTRENMANVAVYRIFLSFWTIAFFLPKLPHLAELYARPILREAHPIYRWLGDPVPPAWLVQLLAGVLLFTLLVFIFARGPALRPLHLIILALMTFFSGLDTVVPRAYGGLALLQWLLLFFAAYERSEAPRAGLRLLMLQFSSVYVFAVLSKAVEGTGWYNGDAIYYSLRSPRFGVFLLSEWFPPSKPVSMMLGWLTMLGEAFVGVGLWFKRWRRLAMLTCLSLHLGMALSMRVSPLFHTLMVGHLLLFVQPELWRRLPLWPSRG